MHIQWFPGHMHKARLQIKEAMPRVDLFIEMLDARIPYSSENPMLAELRGHKPVLKLLAKSDLADPGRTRQWLTYLNQQDGSQAISITTKDPGRIRNLSQVCREMLAPQHAQLPSLTTMIVGIPNVGKSTLINILAGRPVVKTGNEPAITKGQQKINIGDGITLMDTPGVLWPNVENPKSGLRLATIGSIKDTAMDYEDVAWFAAKYMLANYPDGLCKRYDLESLPNDAIEFLEIVGRKRGCLGRSSVVDFDRVSRIFLNELRAGMLGQITLETPAAMEQEKAELVLILAEKEAGKKEKKAKRKAAFKNRSGSTSGKRKHRKGKDPK
jgi:ribosome biogenesis GTPase A